MGNKLEHGYSGLWSGTFAERHPGTGPANFQIIKEENKNQRIFQGSKLKDIFWSSSTQYPIWFSFMTLYNQFI